MFMLAHTWDLASYLDNHMLVRFICDQHSIQRELLLRPAPSPEPTDEELVQGLDDISTLVGKLRADDRSDDNRQLIDLRCTRCDRRIYTVSLPFSAVHACSMWP